MTLEEMGVAKYIFGGILAALMEAVHVELSNEAVDISMPKIGG